MDAQRILPDELAALLLALFAPPLLLAYAGHLLAHPRSGKRKVLWMALLVTTILGPLFGVILMATAPAGWFSGLGVHDLAIGGTYWPVMPLAFITVGIVAAGAMYLQLRYGRPNNSLERSRER
jgi:hypothetical protein